MLREYWTCVGVGGSMEGIVGYRSTACPTPLLSASVFPVMSSIDRVCRLESRGVVIDFS